MSKIESRVKPSDPRPFQFAPGAKINRFLVSLRETTSNVFPEIVQLMAASRQRDCGSSAFRACVGKQPSHLCRRLLQNDPEQPFLVETPQIRAKRLCLANRGLLSREGTSERLEAAIGIDVIYNDCALRCHGRPSSIQFETYVAFTVQAVVNEKIDLSKLGKQLGKAPPARSRYVGPPIRIPIANGRADLLPPKPIHWRKVDAPQMTVSVSIQRFENAARGDAMRDAGLDDLLRPQMASETPDRSRESSIAVIPPLKTLRAGLNPFRLQLAIHPGPYSPELSSRIAGPRNA
jgi:hypothetical protein